MSIAPVEALQSAASQQSSDAGANIGSSRSAPAPSSGGQASVSGTAPKQEPAPTKTSSTTYELPPDVVEVHQDPLSKGQVIIQFLDKSGDVVLQVPSNQELSVERGIAQEFQQAAKLREDQTTSVATSAGEKSHGNKL